MANLNLKNGLTNAYSGNKNTSNHFMYSDNKLLTRIIKIEKEIKNIKATIAVMQKNISSLTSITTTHTKNIGTLDAKSSSNSSNIDSLKSSLNSLNTKLTNTNKSLNKVSSKLSSTTSNVNSLQSSMSSINSSISYLESRINSIRECTCSNTSGTTSGTASNDSIDSNDLITTQSLRSVNSSFYDTNVYDEIDGGENENMEDSQKLDYIVVALDTLNLTVETILDNAVETTNEIKNINDNMKIISKSVNDINTSLVDIKNKIESPSKPIDPNPKPEPDPGNPDPDPKPDPKPEPEEENISIVAKNNVIKTRAGKVINYYISATGLQSDSINIYVNDELSHSLPNIQNGKEFIAFSEIIYKEMNNHMITIMIESEKGTKSNSVQFTVEVLSVFENDELVLSANTTTLYCSQHTEIGFPVIIEGSLDGYCNLYVNGSYVGFIQGFTNGEEFIIYKQKVTTTQDFILQIEYPEGNRSNELVFSVIVDQYVSPDEENKFYLYSDETEISIRSGETVSYVAAIRGLKSEKFKIHINGSYYKTVSVNSSTNLEEYVLYSEDATVNRILYIQIEDEYGRYTNTLSYEVTLINSDANPGSEPDTRDLVINWNDLEHYVNMYDQVLCKANISGLTTDWCNVYVNGKFNRTLSNLQSLNDVVLHEFIAEDDIEINIQIEDSNKIKSNTLKYCIHIKENIIKPDPSEEEVHPSADKTCVEYSKLIGGNRSTWTKGNQELISAISKLGINCLTLSVRMLIPDHTSTTVSIDKEDLALVKSFMLSMRSQGLLNKVEIILEPCPCINKGEVNEREFNPTDKKAFITNWRNEVIKLLNEFTDFFFWGIYVNTNMDILYDQPLMWQEIYDTIKEGRPESNVMIKTNWWESEEDGDMQGFNTKCTADYFKIWDVISVSAYFPLSKTAKSATYNDIYTWLNYGNDFNNRIIKNDIRNLSIALNKPIMLGELGIPAVDYAVTEPSNIDVGSIADEATQKHWYNAWHNTFIDEDWFLGWSFYHMSDLYDSPYDPTNKSAGLYIASLDIQNKYKK